nr:MAG TPA: CD34/Podocalyxin family [Caudoviricetes sp.]
MNKIKNNYKTLLNAIAGLLIAFCLASGIFYHNKTNRLSEELKMANNNIEAY